MKLNRNKYNYRRIVLFLCGLIPSFFSILSFRVKNRIIFNSNFNLEFNQNTKRLFIYFINNHKEFDVKYVVNDSIKRSALIEEYGDFFISSSSIKNIIYILNAKTWVTGTFETPVGGVLLKFRRHVVHLGHGAPIKNIGLNVNEISIKKIIYYMLLKNNFSALLSSSQVFNRAWELCLNFNPRKVLICPQARNSLITDDKISRPKFLSNTSKNILYAPTWRPSSETLLFPFDSFDIISLNSFLVSKNIMIYLRVHPNFEGDGISTNIHSNIKILPHKEVDDISSCLKFFDCLITDYSSIYVDFLLTLKPILFLPYDYSDFNKEIGFYLNYFEDLPGPMANDEKAFKEQVCKLLSNENYFREERVKENNRLNETKSNHCDKAAKLLIEIING